MWGQPGSSQGLARSLVDTTGRNVPMAQSWDVVQENFQPECQRNSFMQSTGEPFLSVLLHWASLLPLRRDESHFGIWLLCYRHLATQRLMHGGGSSSRKFKAMWDETMARTAGDPKEHHLTASSLSSFVRLPLNNLAWKKVKWGTGTLISLEDVTVAEQRYSENSFPGRTELGSQDGIAP